MINKIKQTAQDYIDNQISLKLFEDKILSLMSESEMEVLDDILEDIAYTTTGKLSNEDKENNLITEKEFKSKLKEYLTIL